MKEKPERPISPDIPVHRRPGKRTRVEGEARRVQVHQMLRMKLRPTEMARQLNVDLSTIMSDLRIIREQVKEWYYKQAMDGLIVAHKLSIEVLEERQRKAMMIEADPNLRPLERLEATKLIAEIEVQIWNMLPYTKALMENNATQQQDSGKGGRRVEDSTQAAAAAAISRSDSPIEDIQNS